MKGSDDRTSLHEAVADAIDEEQLARALDLATDGEYEQDAVAALHVVAAEEIVAVVLGATDRARRRGRNPTGDDVGDAADDRQECCIRPPIDRYPLSFDREWP